MAMREYSDTGYGPIDVEHRALSEQLRKFIELVNGNDAQEVAVALHQLLAGVSAHFAHEELLMAEYRYGNTARHCEAHKLFLGDGASFERSILEKGLTPDFRRWAVTRLLEWFRFHIMANDVELGRFLIVETARQAARPAAVGG
jgi:hemerythrin-like metal-binding protein